MITFADVRRLSEAAGPPMTRTLSARLWVAAAWVVANQNAGQSDWARVWRRTFARLAGEAIP